MDNLDSNYIRGIVNVLFQPYNSKPRFWYRILYMQYFSQKGKTT